jgi:hypothetical protein
MAVVKLLLLVIVAQLAERRPVEANVAGSNPVSHPRSNGLEFLKSYAILIELWI